MGAELSPPSPPPPTHWEEQNTSWSPTSSVAYANTTAQAHKGYCTVNSPVRGPVAQSGVRLTSSGCSGRATHIPPGYSISSLVVKPSTRGPVTARSRSGGSSGVMGDTACPPVSPPAPTTFVCAWGLISCQDPL